MLSSLLSLHVLAVAVFVVAILIQCLRFVLANVCDVIIDYS